MLKKRPLAPLVVVLVVTAAMSGAGAASAADIPKLTDNGAYGYFASVSLFGGPPNKSGPTPTVSLPAEGSRAPVSAVIPSGKVQFGPAVLLQSAEEKLSTEGTTGPGGSVTSSASVTGVKDGPTPLLYDKVTSTCTAKGSELSGSTTLAGQLALSTYVAPDPREGEPKDVLPLPSNPAPNTERTGDVSAIGDKYRVVFNEQIRDGSMLTVNAVHLYLLGPVAVGELVLAQTRCGAGVSAGPAGSPAAQAPAPVAAAPGTTAVTGAGAPDRPLAASAADNGGSANPLPLVLGAVVVVLGGGVLLRHRRKAASAHPFGNGGS